MNDNENIVESLLEKIVDYGKTNFELIKLRAVDKTSDVASSIITQAFSIVLFVSFWFFFNIGLAVWLGMLLSKVYYGFFVVTAFYGFIWIVFHFFINKSFKNMVCNNIIKLLLK